jgi:hypothetical protein
MRRIPVLNLFVMRDPFPGPSVTAAESVRKQTNEIENEGGSTVTIGSARQLSIRPSARPFSLFHPSLSHTSNPAFFKNDSKLAFPTGAWPRIFSDNRTTSPLMEKLNTDAALLKTFPFEVNLWKARNICYKILHACCSDFNKRPESGDENAQGGYAAPVISRRPRTNRQLPPPRPPLDRKA